MPQSRTLLAAKINLDVIMYEGQQYHPIAPETRLQGLIGAVRTDVRSVRIGRASGVRWRFLSVERLPDGLIYGRVCKIRERVIERAPENQEPIREIAPDMVVAEACFVLDAMNEILVFENRAPDIEPLTLVRAFKRLCVQADPLLADFMMVILPDSPNLLAAIEEFRKVTRVQFDIVHANWHFSRALNDLDEALKAARARTGSVRLANPRGLERKSDLVTDALGLVEGGYGHVKISGREAKGKGKTVDSRQMYLQDKVEATDSKLDRIGMMVSFLRRVLGRRR